MRRRLLSGLLVGVPIAVVLLGAGAYLAVALSRTAPALSFRAARVPTTFPGGPPRMAWPAGGEAAVEVEGIGPLGSSGGQRPLPIASVAKVMTALVVLHDHPLAAGAEGPEIPITQSDVAVYRADRATGQSVVRVSAGEELTERQALEALLLPSANNVATLLAAWDAGSEAAFVNKMNAQARVLGLSATRYADASGFDPSTVSTARDQARLAMVALTRPGFAQIVAMREVLLPVAGLQPNRDDLLGKMGIVGVKTGNTSEAGGCFVFASRQLVAGRRLTVVGAVLGQPLTPDAPQLLDGAFATTSALLRSLTHVLESFGVLAHRRPLGWLTARWGDRVPVRPDAARLVLGWSGMPVHVHLVAAGELHAPLRLGQDVGRVVVRAGAQRIKLRLVVSSALPTPSLGWRLTHP
jgi:D-alanyl-D-alanine carboxypeptidase (penicillin-binding protein 5/6)